MGLTKERIDMAPNEATKDENNLIVRRYQPYNGPTGDEVVVTKDGRKFANGITKHCGDMRIVRDEDGKQYVVYR